MNIGIDVHCKTAKPEEWKVELVQVEPHGYEPNPYYRLRIGRAGNVVLYLTEEQVRDIRRACSLRPYNPDLEPVEEPPDPAEPETVDPDIPDYLRPIAEGLYAHEQGE